MKEVIQFLLYTAAGLGTGFLGEAGKDVLNYIKKNFPKLQVSKKIDEAKKSKDKSMLDDLAKEIGELAKANKRLASRLNNVNIEHMSITNVEKIVHGDDNAQITIIHGNQYNHPHDLSIPHKLFLLGSYLVEAYNYKTVGPYKKNEYRIVLATELANFFSIEKYFHEAIKAESYEKLIAIAEKIKLHFFAKYSDKTSNYFWFGFLFVIYVSNRGKFGEVTEVIEEGFRGVGSEIEITDSYIEKLITVAKDKVISNEEFKKTVEDTYDRILITLEKNLN